MRYHRYWKSKTGLITASLLSLLATDAIFAQAVRAACMQNQAVYSDVSDTYTLTFRPEVEADYQLEPAPTNEFTITAASKPDFKLTGLVIWDGEKNPRPTGLIMNDCRGDGVMPEEIEECSVWQGVVYSLKDNADAGLLPKPAEPAAPALLFPDLIAAFNTVNFGESQPEQTLDWEVFRYKQCNVEEE